MPKPRLNLLRVNALAAVDPAGLVGRPAALLLALDPPRAEVLAVGNLSDVGAHPAASAARTIDLPRSVLLPGLVNSHTHLDLTGLGPLPHDPEEGFVPWLNRIRARRLASDEEIAQSVRRGVELCLAGGTVAVGDIAGLPGSGHTLSPLRELRASPLEGVSFLEFFATGDRRAAGMERLRACLSEHAAELRANEGGVRAGLEPHAPYTVDLRAYEAAAELGRALELPLVTHLAESAEERRFVARGEGPLVDLLRSLGLLGPGELPTGVGEGRTPVSHLAEAVDPGGLTLVHCNDLTDEDIELLARAGASVVYCPRAAAYFDAPGRLGPHRYRELLDAGVGVALGTDSIVNLPATAADPASGGISVLDEMRLLHRRDGTDPGTLLRMGTVLGARALGLESDQFTSRAGSRLSGLLHLPLNGARETVDDPLRAVLRSDAPAHPLVISGRYVGETAGSRAPSNL